MMSRPHLSRVLVGTLLLPAVFGALVLWSLADRAERADRVPAAVVNLDQPVTKGKGKDKQVIAAGRLLAGGLTSPTGDTRSSLGWELTDADDAEDGLREGRYYAVIVIPEDFSRTVSSVTGDDPRAARLSVQSNDASSPLVAEASSQVAQVAAARLGHRVTATYLQGIFEQSGKLRLELGKASDAAEKVASGADRLEDGAGRLGSGAERLAGGAGQLADGAGRLGGGAERLADGAARLSRGTDRLAAGADRLAHGLHLLDERTDPLPRQTDRLADGARQVADGVAVYADLLTAWKQACTGDPIVAGAQPRLCAATVQAVGAQDDNAEQLRSGARQVADGARQLADATPRLTGAIGRTADGSGRLAGGLGDLAAGTERLADGAQRLSGGAGRLAGGARAAGDGAELLAGGSAELSEGSARLGSGSERLATGLADGAGRIPDAGKDAAEVVADPVATEATTLNPAEDGATSLAPVVLAFGLWLGAFVTYLVRPALPATGLRAARPGWRIALSGWLPALLTGVVQAALLVGAALAFGASFSSPLGLVFLVLLCVAVFTAVNQAFVAVLGRRRGWIAAIAFTALQAVALGGLVPIETAPDPVQGLNGLLPVARAADGLGLVGLGGQVGSPVADAVVLLLWGAVALAASTLAARRRQQVTLDDVRRSVAAVR